jgi:hypothetical protein
MAFTDAFTDDDDVLLQDHTPTGGGAWTRQVDGATRALIEANAVTFRAGGGGSGRSVWICTDQGSANHYTQVKQIAFPTLACFVCARLVDEDNLLYSECPGTGGTGHDFGKIVAGVDTALVETQGADESTIKIECSGATIKFYINGDQRGGDITETAHQSETSQGFSTDQTPGDTAQYDDFEADSLAAPPSFIPKVIMIQ